MTIFKALAEMLKTKPKPEKKATEVFKEKELSFTNCFGCGCEIIIPKGKIVVGLTLCRFCSTKNHF